jgi:hypothetical protein
VPIRANPCQTDRFGFSTACSTRNSRKILICAIRATRAICASRLEFPLPFPACRTELSARPLEKVVPSCPSCLKKSTLQACSCPRSGFLPVLVDSLPLSSRVPPAIFVLFAPFAASKNFFQSLENGRKIFPIIGKTAAGARAAGLCKTRRTGRTRARWTVGDGNGGAGLVGWRRHQDKVVKHGILE